MSGGPMGESLAGMVVAADASMQAAVSMWSTMSDEEKEEWLSCWSTCWPRLDVYLPVVLSAAQRIIEREAEVRREEDGP